MASVYDLDKTDPKTFQTRITNRHRYYNKFWDGTTSFNASETKTSTSCDVSADNYSTLFVQTVKDFTIVVEVCDYEDEYAFYTLCDTSGNALSFNCSGAAKAIPLFIKGVLLRVKATNNGAQADSPYIALI